jgi:hypothetical protein
MVKQLQFGSIRGCSVNIYILQLTGKHLLGSMSRSTSTPVIKPFTHGDGYSNSSTVVLNDAKMTLLTPEPCISSACINSFPRSCCRSVKLRTSGKVCKINYINGVLALTQR